jgi:mannose-6-phosphate isomerase-like protein (cupin superfamily)
VKESIALMNSSTIHLASGEGSKSLWVLGELVTYKVTAEQTGGAYSLFEVVTRPGGGPSPHVQHQEDECFYVLEGEFEFLNNGDVVGVGAGSLVYVPRGNLHTYKNVGSEPGRILMSQTPGGCTSGSSRSWARKRKACRPYRLPRARLISRASS